MPAELRPLLTPDLLGRAFPDRIQIGVFADSPRVMTRKLYTQYTRNAEAYFQHRHGAERHEGKGDPLGLHYAWREGAVTIKLGIGPRSFSMAVIFNPSRDLAVESGVAEASDRHSNTVIPLLEEGYLLPDLRRGICADIADRAAWARTRYAELLPNVLGLTACGAVHSNFSQLELDYDLPVDKPEVLKTYQRPFYKVFTRNKGAEAGRLSGELRRGERFVVYPKKDLLRFEAALSGARVKEVMETQRVPDDGAGVERVLLALEQRYLPIWMEVERHRFPDERPCLRDFLTRLPHVRNWAKLDRVADDLGRSGKVATPDHDRVVVEALRRRGLIENLNAKTRVRGFRVAAPGTDSLWRAWRAEL